MRNFELVVSFGLLLAIGAQAQTPNWIRQNPVPVGPSIYLFDVSAVDSQSACVVGQYAEMGITVNGGQNWSGVYPGKRLDLRASSFVNSETGWVVGDSGFISKTVDGGLSWEIQSSGTEHPLQDVQFVDSLVGYVVGDTNTILKTIDGGATWGALTVPDSTNYLALSFLNADTGWVSGVGVIARTDDGGATWTQQGPANGYYRTMWFANKDTGWVGERFANVYSTYDGGANWSMLYSFPTSDFFWLYEICFPTTQIGWAAGAYQASGSNNDGRIMVTRDGGVTWARQAHSGQTFLSVAFNDTNTGWAVGTNSLVVQTADGGETWTDAVQGPTDDLNDVFFTSKDMGWAVGGSSWDSTLILHTQNGGLSWAPQQSPVKNVGLESVFFHDSLLGWAAGQDMTLLKTVDGGVTWTGQSGSTTDLQRIFFSDQSNGWVVGGNSLQSAVVRKTVDGGTNWQSVSVPVTSQFNDVFFLNPDTGWIAGSNGSVIRTINGGTSFEALSDSALGRVMNVHFLNLTVGWVAGSNGVFITSDGGSTWVRQLAAGTQLGAYFVDPMTIYMIAGSNSSPFPGYVHRTTDAGLTWETQFLQNGVLWSGGVHFEDANTGWVVSGGGTILHTANGGGDGWVGINRWSFPVSDIVPANMGFCIAAASNGIRFLWDRESGQDVRLTVFDLLGRSLWSYMDLAGRKRVRQTVWPTTDQRNGAYVVEYRQGSRRIAQPILLTR